MHRNMRSGAATLLLFAIGCSAAQSSYYGKEVGALSELHHGVRGRVYAIDSRTLFLRDFHYDGEGPAAYFYVGSSKAPGSSGGARLRDERGGTEPLRRYRGESITLALPDGKTLRDIKWFSVWCDEFSVNFGDVSISRELEYPKPVKVSALRGVHGVGSDPIVVVDAQTLLIPNFSYDGEAPDAKFWVGRGDKPSPQGIRIPDENGKENPLRRYDKKTIVLTLPGELTVFDIGHFAVWCEAFTVNFGHVTLPRNQLSNIPPSLKMLGVSPQSRNKELVKGSSSPSSSQHKRPRRPLARLDATTYRPQLAPGAGPLAALQDPPAARAALHRRADTHAPPRDQLLDAQDKDAPGPAAQPYRLQADDDQAAQLYTQQNNDYQQQIPSEDNQQQKVDQQQPESYQQQSNYRDENAPKYQTQPDQYNQEPQKYQLQPEPVPQQPTYQQNSQIIPEQYQAQNENYQQQRSQEFYYHEPITYQTQQNYFQQPQYQNEQLYQQRAYQEALNEQYRRFHPQYHLVPYYSPQAGRL